MTAPEAFSSALEAVHDQASFVEELLSNPDALGWPIEGRIESIREISYGWSPDELRADGLEKHLLDSQAWQIQPFQQGQPWGIFLLEFAHDKVYRTLLRQVLRGLVPNRRRDPNLQAWQHENLLFICTTREYKSFTFAHFRGSKPASAKLATFSWQRGDSHLRTVCEFNLPALVWPEDGGADSDAWLKGWTTAFDKEPLTKDFFKRFDAAIEAVQSDLVKHQKLSSAEAYSKAQLLLERLVFLYFLQNRGWLDQQHDFLPACFEPYRAKPKEFSFYGEFVSATLSKRPTFALSRGPAPSAPENIFSPQIPSATGEGDLWRKNVVKMVARL